MTAVAFVRSIERPGPSVIQAILLSAGVAASLVYFVADIVCGWLYPNYSFSNQVISELSAIGAPTTALWATLLQAFSVLFAMFTIAIVREGRTNRGLRLTGWLLASFVLSGPLWSIFPMHQRGDAFTWTDKGHIALGGVMVFLISALIASAAGALGARFRLFSRVLLGMAFATGVGTFAYVPRMIDQQPTPGVGTLERIFLYAFLLWMGTLAIALLWRRRRALDGRRS